ncbi:MULTISPECIES: zinc-dependent alcohol dehydrogenase family protein [unclassified Gilliamella]|uniref:zinc-dependent alcohol dehydrogenase family protein n=1 Tax=unclassified Gilliamella TaxID=2685620 RepID=UPI000A34D4ED|nr:MULTISPECIES: zinc-dependent alcohol dehydrogenase family protein [unclassified Gilliamella]OTQ75514.1 hypothetical protein B6C99_00320 [Gilliamella sp. N-G2]OTQ80680.1 hypothetical protein B6D23_01080 [Gilliamella sp. N-W3]
MNAALFYRKFGLPEQVLTLEYANKSSLKENYIRVQMLYAPINASNLIPITGAYQHRITLPQIAGYEGIGKVIEAPLSYQHLIGKRVLPLRGEGTWQNFVDLPAEFAIEVPDSISDITAARAYINSVAAWLMLKHYSSQGKHILVTAAGSDCAKLLCNWAIKFAALSVTVICRSDNHAQYYNKHTIKHIKQDDKQTIEYFARQADIVFDAVGGELAETILAHMPDSSEFVSYGLLSGAFFQPKKRLPKVHWFHIRHYLNQISSNQWLKMFDDIWPILDVNDLTVANFFEFNDWQAAIKNYRQPYRNNKPLLIFD